MNAVTVTTGAGVVTLSRGYEEMTFHYRTEGLTFNLTLDLDTAKRIGELMRDSAGEQPHPEACLTCGSLTPTRGCQGDDSPVTYWVCSRRNNGDGEDAPTLLLACASEAEAHEEANRMHRNDAALHTFSRQYFVTQIREENDD